MVLSQCPGMTHWVPRLLVPTHLWFSPCTHSLQESSVLLPLLCFSGWFPQCWGLHHVPAWPWASPWSLSGSRPACPRVRPSPWQLLCRLASSAAEAGGELLVISPWLPSRHGGRVSSQGGTGHPLRLTRSQKLQRNLLVWTEAVQGSSAWSGRVPRRSRGFPAEALGSAGSSPGFEPRALPAAHRGRVLERTQTWVPDPGHGSVIKVAQVQIGQGRGYPFVYSAVLI